MTDHVSARGPARRTRRQLLAGGTGALAVLTAEALARPASAAAADGGNVVLGQDNSEATVTSITNSTDGDDALLLTAAGSGTGLFSQSGSGDGVHGTSDSGNGVSGKAFSSGASGILGEHGGGGNGVFGHASNPAASGVYGQNDGTGFGVAGRADGGTGLLGDSADGVGVWASSQNGTALKVTGAAQFSRSGVATVAGTAAAPKNSVRVSLPITGTSMMTALLQKHVAGVWVVAAVANVRGGYFTIYLNKAVSTPVGPIAWMVTEQP